nr:N-acetyltransferase [Geminicoccus roseus]
MLVRDERPGDQAPLRALVTAAFTGHPHSDGSEPGIVDALRADGALAISLVAELGGDMVGQAAFSPVRIGDGSTGWYGLGPVAVAPERQGQGIGSALIEEGLRRLRAQGASGCVVLGEPGYYRRFGFAQDPALTLEGPPAEYFLALRFQPTPAQGAVAYHAAFGGPE